jgi:RIO kinase 1
MVTLTYQERFKTVKGVFDAFTNRTLFDLQTKGYFDELVSPLFVGKESNVFIALKDDEKIIVKIYRLQNCDFKNMYDYIHRDGRYSNLKRDRRQIILSWTQREYKNILKAKKAGICVPEVIAVKNNVLIEKMIGSDEPAPRLKDYIPEDIDGFFKILLEEMKNLYQKANLVHGDLSAFNVLNDNETPVLIDFSQATLAGSDHAKDLLKRDIKNIASFARKQGFKIDEEKVFKEITI